MTNGSNRLLDDLAKLMTDAAGAAQGVRREVETAFKAQAERLLNSMEVVQREEFDAVRDMAVKARAETRRWPRGSTRLKPGLRKLTGPPPARRAQTPLPRAVRKNNYSFLFHKAWKGKSLFGESLTRLP